VTVTHPDKVLWPEDGITKGDLIAYYREMAPVILPHVRGRPLVMRPFPRGIHGPAYYRQTLPKSAPAWLPRFRHVAKADGHANEMPVIDDLSVLLWLANQAAIEVHPWLSRVDRPEQPDFVVFDLDIERPENFPVALRVALFLHEALARIGVRSYAKTSGGDGVHVYVPIARGPRYEETRAWAQAVAETLERARPDLVTTRLRRDGREEAVLVDYAQNALGRTTVAVYSVRPRPGAPVSTPLTWDEVAAGAVRPGDFTMRTVLERVRRLGDLFAPVLAGGQRLPAPL
jgi:bifunctional non-homologous end joining protein LigD